MAKWALAIGLLLSALAEASIGLQSEIQGLQLKKNGPNCWNSALINADIVHSIRYVSRAEYWFWMKSPYCHALSPKDTLLPGDLGAMIWPKKGHLHSFTYLDEHTVFSKNSPSAGHPYRKQPFVEMFYPHYRETAAQCGVRPSLTTKGRPCGYEILYYRCQPLEENFYSRDVALRAMDLRVQAYEKKVRDWVKGRRSQAHSNYSQVIRSIYGEWMSVRTVLAKRRVSADSLLAWKAMEFRLVGLLLSDTQVSQAYPKLESYVQAAFQFQKDKNDKRDKKDKKDKRGQLLGAQAVNLPPHFKIQKTTLRD